MTLWYLEQYIDLPRDEFNIDYTSCYPQVIYEIRDGFKRSNGRVF